jgi:hypothetical protein
VRLEHESLETTMIYTHVARKGPAGVASPLDFLAELTREVIEDAAVASRRMQGNAGACQNMQDAASCARERR